MAESRRLYASSMTKMTRNQRQGSAAELRVALTLVEAGCAVNSLTQMDYGTDLLVQVPEQLPTRQRSSWKMSHRTAALQVKSSRTDRPKAGLRYGDLVSWSVPQQRTSPVFVVLCVGESHYLFDAECYRKVCAAFYSRQLEENEWCEAERGLLPGLDDIKIALRPQDGHKVASTDLANVIVHWTKNATHLDALSIVGISFPLPVRPLTRDEVLTFVSRAVAAYVVHFNDYKNYVDFGAGVQNAEELASEMLEVFALPNSNVYQEVTNVMTSVPMVPRGWGAADPLHLFTYERNKEAAFSSLIGVAQSLNPV